MNRIFHIKSREEWDRERAMPSARATHEPSPVSRSRPAVGIAIAIALTGCSHHGELLIGEAQPVDYQMAGMLATANTPSGALARKGLADGYLSASEASAMWDAYRAEAYARAIADKNAVISRWKRTASAMSAGTAETTQIGSGLQPASAAPKEDAR